MANEGAHLYDAANDAIELDYAFENKGVDTLLTLFNNTTPKLLSLYEKREFLTYFFLGTHTIPELTPQQAWDFKTTFDIQNFPANGIPDYISWLKENGNDYKNAFPYPVIDGNGRIKSGKWKVAYVSDLINDFTNIVNNQHNYGNWLNDISKDGGSWQSGTDKLSMENNIKPFFAKLSGLFASGKFVTYYEDYVKPDLQKLTYGHATFDPYTGNITIKSKLTNYTKEFSKLASMHDEYANMLFNDQYIKNKTLPYQHRFFCLLCQWIASVLPDISAPTYSEKIIENVRTYWDLTPSDKNGSLPKAPIAGGFKILTDTNLLTYIKALGEEFLSETLVINDGNTSFKDLWNGAKMKLNSSKDIDCPFFYVIHVDFDSVDPIDNPFAGQTLTRMNEMIAETLKYRDALQEKIFEMNKNLINNKSCVTSITDMSTVIFEEGATNNNFNIDAKCSFKSDEEIAAQSNEEVKEENNGSPNQPVTPFVMNRLSDSDKNQESTIETPSEEKKIEEQKMNKTIIIIAVIIAVLVVLGIGIWLYRRRKNNSVKKDEEESLIP